MHYALDHIATALKAAREANGLSQRALSELAGVPQSHISKIEKGSVDLRVSSLIELARLLGLELVLVPRKSVPAVNSIIRSTTPAVRTTDPDYRAEFERLRRTIAALRRTDPASSELAQLQRLVRDLQHMNVSSAHLEAVREITRSLQAIQGGQHPEDLRQILTLVQQLRNRVTLEESLPPVEKVRPAYSLEEDEHEQ